MSSKRKTFVLKCDKPRYDGGVEIDLKQYFGDRFTSDASQLKALAQLQLTQAQRTGLGKDALMENAYMEVPHYYLTDEASDQAIEAVVHHEDEHGLEDRISQAWVAESNRNDEVLPQPQSPELTTPSNTAHTGFKLWLIEGPVQFIIACTGLSTACLALCSLGLLANPEGIAKKAHALLKSCHTLLIKSLINTMFFPFKGFQMLK